MASVMELVLLLGFANILARGMWFGENENENENEFIVAS